MSVRGRQHLFVLALLAGLALLAYLPLFTQPLLEDDYPNIVMARDYGLSVFVHPTDRFRATSFLVAFAADALFGCSAAALHGVSIALHILATWLVYALGAWQPIGWRVASVGAGFFAVYEGHQEAVMWYAASSEELMSIFGLLAFLCWVRFLETPARRTWYAAALGSFVLALASKESAVIFVPLMLLPLAGFDAKWRRLLLWLPFAALAVGDGLLIAATRSYSPRFHDGSFSLTAPLWITWTVSFGRLLWAWGLIAVLVLLWLRGRRMLVIGGVWIALALLPYSFVTYMHRIPSRQVYLASVGLAWLVGAAFWALRPRMRRSRALLMGLLAALVLTTNIGYLWTRKRQQFLARAAPTEALVAMARRTRGPIYVRCFPELPIIAETAVRLRSPGTTLLWKPEPDAAAEFCWK